MDIPAPRKTSVLFSLFLLSLASLIILIPYPLSGGEKDSCVSCHSDPDFLVKNKKLYDYFQNWKYSIHSMEKVSCADCHGGNPAASSKAAAHASKVGGAESVVNSINYRNIPATCAKCHKSIYEKFKGSEHFKHLLSKSKGEQGPNCVTCHGSVSISVLNVNSVRETCEKCHNAKSGNNPDIPLEAEEILNNFLSIQRYFRFIGVRSGPKKARSYFEVLEPMIKNLSAEWHSFNLKRVENETKKILNVTRAIRNEIKSEEKGRR